jgi:hypothetical protein
MKRARQAARAGHPGRQALTLIEIIVALVLASLLTAGLLQLVGAIAIESRQLRSEPVNPVAAQVLADRVHTDLINARGMQADTNTLRLAGFVPPQLTTGQILYQTRVVEGARVLVRQTATQQQLCWIGFGGFRVRSDETLDAETPVPKSAAGLPPVPRRCRVELFDDRGRVLVSEMVRHHGL